MRTDKMGRLISDLRKERGLTQKQLGDILGVSAKAVSKWECGSGLPDISIIKKISEEFDITMEELLDGTKKNVSNNKNKMLIIIIGIILFIFITSFFLIRKNSNSEVYDCTVIKTYLIRDILGSNDENYGYIIIGEFQVEGSFTVKLSKIEIEKLDVGESYEFTFETNRENVNVTTDVLFDNSNIINIKKSNKVGLDRVNTYSCN